MKGAIAWGDVLPVSAETLAEAIRRQPWQLPLLVLVYRYLDAHHESRSLLDRIGAKGKVSTHSFRFRPAHS